jgi:hypothetical protein
MSEIKTRSQTSVQLYSVDIDFDEAREAWRENKKSLPNGMFKYVCGCPTKSGSKCARVPKTGHQYCSTHIVNQDVNPIHK